MYTEADYSRAAKSHCFTPPAPATLRRLVREQKNPDSWAKNVDAKMRKQFTQAAAQEEFAVKHGYGSAAEMVADQWPNEYIHGPDDARDLLESLDDEEDES